MKKVATHRCPRKKAAAAQSKTVYRVRNWSAYNRALIGRGSLTVWLSEAALAGWHYTGPPQRGAQFYYSDLAIETVLTLRLVLHLPLRQTQGLVRSLMGLLDVPLAVPDYSTLSRRQAALEVALPVRPKGEPLHLVVDSSGVKVYGEGEWKVRQYGWSYRRTWRKLHLGFDADSGEIVAQVLTVAGVDDASQLRPMLDQLDGPVDRCTGDGSYDRWSVLHTLAYPPNQQTPIEAVIPPQRNARVRTAKRRYRHIEARNQRVNAIHRVGRKRWKKASGYHRRSLAESGLSRYKRILGPTLRSRTLPGQQVEARLGCSLLNRMLHLGKPDSYPVEIPA